MQLVNGTVSKIFHVYPWGTGPPPAVRALLNFKNIQFSGSGDNRVPVIRHFLLKIWRKVRFNEITMFRAQPASVYNLQIMLVGTV